MEQLKPFTSFSYQTIDGENITVTKKNGMVTLVGDKNGVRQMELADFRNYLIETAPKINRALPKDTVSFSGTKDATSALTKQDKQKIIKAANKNASGWSCFGGPVSTLYYALRSDKTIAEKYNLDVNKDKDFISDIRENQVLWTIPSIPGLGFPAYLYNLCRNENKINVD